MTNLKNKTTRIGWKIGESIMLELDMVLNLVNRYTKPSNFEHLDHLYQQIPNDIITDFQDMLPQEHILMNPLMKAALILGLNFQNDYKNVSLRIRKTTIDELTRCFKHRLIQLKFKPDQVGSDFGTRLNLLNRLILDTELKSLTMAGFDPIIPQVEKEIHTITDFISLIVRGGRLEYEFWHCMDRFYYGHYQTWREKQNAEFESQKSKALVHLKKPESYGALPNLEWLRESHPIIDRPSLIQGIRDLNCVVHLVALPFNHFDMFHVEPGYCMFTLSESAWKNKRWISNLESLANGIKAISDPTRLTILRAIRHHHKYTTELAAFMNLSRPTVSEHCKILHNQGFIDTYTEGRKSYHRVKPGPIKQLLRQLDNYLDLPEMDRIKK